MGEWASSKVSVGVLLCLQLIQTCERVLGRESVVLCGCARVGVGTGCEIQVSP